MRDGTVHLLIKAIDMIIKVVMMTMIYHINSDNIINDIVMVNTDGG